MFGVARLYYTPRDHSKWRSDIPKGNNDSTAFRRDCLVRLTQWENLSVCFSTGAPQQGPGCWTVCFLFCRTTVGIYTMPVCLQLKPTSRFPHERSFNLRTEHIASTFQGGKFTYDLLIMKPFVLKCHQPAQNQVFAFLLLSPYLALLKSCKF